MKKFQFKRLLLLLLTTMCVDASAVAQSVTLRKIGIDSLFALAETGSRNIRALEIAAQEAAQAVKVARSGRLPDIDMSLSASYLGDGWIADRDFSNGANAPMPHFGNNFAIEASQVVYAGGAVSNALRLAKVQHQSAVVEQQLGRQEVRFLLVGNYLELFSLRNRVQVYEDNIRQTEQLLSDIRAKEREGLALQNDITRYELQLQSLQLSLVQTQNAIKIVNDRLITALCLPKNTVIEVDESIIDSFPSTDGAGVWRDVAAVKSPQLRLSALGVQQSRYGEKLTAAERIPSIALFAGDRFDGPIIIEVPPINKNFNYWYVGVGLKFNIGATYKTGKKLQQARLATRRAQEQERLAQDNVRTDVTAAYVTFEEAFTIYRTRQKSLELAQQNYDVINKRYLNGLALITDMLDASTSRLDAQLAVANAGINIVFQYYALRKVAGIL